VVFMSDLSESGAAIAGDSRRERILYEPGAECIRRGGRGESGKRPEYPQKKLCGSET